MHITVRVSAGAKRERVERLSPTRLVISVTEEAEHNQANRRVVALLAERFGVGVGAVRLVNGHHKPTKLFEINLGER